MSQEIVPEKRVLVVDDEPVIARIFEKVLTAEGFSVEVAADGNTARDISLKETFDLCILNIHLPGMSGIELYKFLLREKPGLGARILFTTGDVLSRDTEAFLKEAKRPVLLKPFNPEELKIAVKVTMRQPMP